MGATHQSVGNTPRPQRHKSQNFQWDYEIKKTIVGMICFADVFLKAKCTNDFDTLKMGMYRYRKIHNSKQYTKCYIWIECV